MAAAWAAMQAAERREWVLALSQAKEEKRAAQAALRLGGRVQRQGEEWGQPPSGGRPREVQAPVALPARASENRRARRRKQLARPDEAAPAARLIEVGESPARPPAREGPDIQRGQGQCFCEEGGPHARPQEVRRGMGSLSRKTRIKQEGVETSQTESNKQETEEPSRAEYQES